MWELLIRKGKEPQIRHDPGESARGEHCVIFRSGLSSRPMVRGHSLKDALRRACISSGLRKVDEAEANDD